jgi:hypothetical protein
MILIARERLKLFYQIGGKSPTIDNRGGSLLSFAWMCTVDFDVI